MKKYLSAEERKKWLQIYFVGQAIEELKDNTKKYNTNTIKYLRSAFTYLVKSFDAMIHDYPQHANTLVNDMEYYRLLFLPKEQAYTEMDRKIAEKQKNPIDALYDCLDVAMEQSCIGCQGKENCRLKNMLEFYKITEVDPDDEICKWRL